MPTVTFWVPGKPIAQPRPRVTTRGGFGRAYVPADHPVHTWRKAVAATALAHRHPEWPVPMPAPIKITAHFRAERPKRPPKGQVAWTTRPDRDNLEKAVLDAIEGIIMQSDSQVVGGEVTKSYSCDPGVWITVEWGESVEPWAV